MGEILLSAKEARRVYVIELLATGKLTAGQAAQLLNLTKRQVQRLKGGYLREGAAALAHQNRGRKPAHAVSETLKELIVQLVTGPYRNTSCQHMAELLDEHEQIRLCSKTIRRILKTARIPLRYPKKSARRRRSRDRMPQEGLLLQGDASPYAWLEERGPILHLHGAIDDASGKILGLHLDEQETTTGYLHVLEQALQNHGLPGCFYSDRHTIFVSPKKDKLTIEEELAGKTVPLTQFGRALQALQIRQISAYSPQAKGRVERLWQTLQSRLVVEMRVAGINSLAQANAFLPSFIPRYNRRFAVQPKDPQRAFAPCPPPETLQKILALHDTRQASHGSTFSYLGTTYQLTDAKGQVVPLRAKTKITILHGLDGSLHGFYEDQVYQLLAVPKPQRVQENPKTATANQKHSGSAFKPKADHPWRKPKQRTTFPGPGRLERFLDQHLDQTQDQNLWTEIYARR